MLDRALAKTFASFSTLFLMACLVTVPLHEVHASVFKDALAIRELAPEVSAFPEGRQVRGVDKGDIDAERTWLIVVLAIELALTAIVYRAARRVIAVADAGGIPGVLDAYKHLGAPGHAGTPPAGPAVVGIAFGCVCAWLVWKIGEIGAELATPDTTWAAVGLVRGVAVGIGMALAAGTSAALTQRPKAAAPEPAEIDVY